MPIQSLDHVNLRTSRLEELKHFYSEVLGFTEGPRPGFSFNGAWMYCGSRPVVHLVEVEPASAPSRGRLTLQHFAFSGTDLAGFLRVLDSHGVRRRLSVVKDFDLFQVALADPDGNELHVDFFLDEARALNVAE